MKNEIGDPLKTTLLPASLHNVRGIYPFSKSKSPLCSDLALLPWAGSSSYSVYLCTHIGMHNFLPVKGTSDSPSADLAQRRSIGWADLF